MRANYRVTAIPTTIFIAPSGEVFERWSGLIDLDTLSRIAESMISEPPDKPTPSPTPNCGYSFAYLDHPELSEEINTNLEPTGQGVTSVVSQAYGENRFCGQEVVGFSAMETTIKLTLEADSLPAIEEVATLMSSVLGTLPTGYDPNFGPRFIITFVAGDSEAKADFSMHTLSEVRDKQVQGPDLLEALGYRPLPSP